MLFNIYQIRSKVVVFIFSLFFSSIFFALPVFARNSPDSNHCTLTASNQAPADGRSTITVTVSLQDSSSVPLSGDNVSFSDSNNSSAVFNPTSTSLDASGKATFTITSTKAGTDNITVTDTSTNTVLTNLGQVTFTPSFACTDSAPGSTAQLKSAVANGSGQITLTWTDATNPVSYYLVSYGTKSGQYIYGNPNVGGQGTTSYTIKNLAKGTTYYFVVRAGNGCAPGNFSNELSAMTTGGVVVNTPIPTKTSSVNSSLDTNNQNDIAPTDILAPAQDIQPTVVITTRGQALMALFSKAKIIKYIFICIFVLGSLGGFVYWKYKARHLATDRFRHWKDI